LSSERGDPPDVEPQIHTWLWHELLANHADQARTTVSCGALARPALASCRTHSRKLARHGSPTYASTTPRHLPNASPSSVAVWSSLRDPTCATVPWRWSSTLRARLSRCRNGRPKRR
jgi:hypothetical protein